MALRDPVAHAEYNRQWRRRNRVRANAVSAAYKEKNREKAKVWSQKTNLKKNYGLSLEAFESLKAGQNNRCACCEAEGKKLVVDHCHITGKIRGLLCRTCNSGIGQLGDTLLSVQKAVRYMEENGA